MKMKKSCANGRKTLELKQLYLDDQKNVNNEASKGLAELKEGLRKETQAVSASKSVSHCSDTNGELQFYPPPLASHRDVVRDAKLFASTLDRFLIALGTRLTVPKIRDKEIDLHAFYREVTAHGGLEQVIRSGCWKKVCEALKLHRAYENRYYVLRKHYVNLLFHYEQVYFFRVGGQLLSPPVPLPAPISVKKPMESSAPYTIPPEMRSSVTKKKQKLDPEQIFGVDPAASIGAVATGAICGKFDEGYFVTVVVGSEKLSGVLYHFSPREKAQQFASVPSLLEGVGSEVTTTGLEIQIYGTKKEHAKDPNTRKRTRTGYNIYLKEQGARLKELYPGSKGLGKKLIEMWNKLPEEEKSYYNALGSVERERHMAEYREKLKAQSLQGDHSTANGAEGSTPVARADHGTYYVNQDYHVSLDVESEAQAGHASVPNCVREQAYHGYHANEPLVESETAGGHHFVPEKTYELQDDREYHQQPPSEEEEEDDDAAEECYEEEEDETIYRSADKILEQQEEEEEEEEEEREEQGQGQEEYKCEYQDYDIVKQAHSEADAAPAAILERAYYGQDRTYSYLPPGSQASSTHISSSSSSSEHLPYSRGRDSGQIVYDSRLMHGPQDMGATNMVPPQHLFSHDRFGYSAAQPGPLALFPQHQTSFSCRQEEDAHSYIPPSLKPYQNQGSTASSIRTQRQLPSEQGYQNRFPYHFQMPHAQMHPRPSPPAPHPYTPRFPHPSYHMQWNNAEAFHHGHGGYVPQLHHPQAVIPDIAAVSPATDHAYQAPHGGETKH